MAEPSVGSDQDEQVREPGDRRAAVRLRPTGPHLSQGASLPAANPSSHRHIRDVKSGAQDNRVYLPSGAVGGLHPIRAGSGHARRHHLDVRLGQGGQVVVGDQNALAADGVVRGQLGAQLGIIDLAAQVPIGRHFSELEQPGADRKSGTSDSRPQ